MPTKLRSTLALVACAATGGCLYDWNRTEAAGTGIGVTDAGKDGFVYSDAGQGEVNESGLPVDARSDRGNGPDANEMDVVGAETSTGPITFVQSGINSGMQKGTTLSTTITATQHGSLLVVGVDQDDTSSGAVMSIHDNAGNSYVLANRGVDDNCPDSAEIWYAKDIAAGAQTVTVTMNESVTIEVWVAEFSGLSTTSPLDKAVAMSGGLPPVSAPPVMPSTSRALIVSLTTVCGYIAGSVSSPFVGLPLQNGNDLAYYIPPSASASSSATWNGFISSWTASTASFR